MTKRNTTKETKATSQSTAEATEAAMAKAIADSAIEAATSDALPRSVVGVGYKAEYRRKALEAGRTSKASRRCNGDWLAQELEARCLDDDERLLVGAFEAILDENGVQHSHWNRITNGWQGRLRMSGSMSLRAKLKKQGFLLMGGERVEAPKAQPLQAAE